MSDNITTFVRVRPLPAGRKRVVDTCEEGGMGTVTAGAAHRFVFDAAFNAGTQEEVFERVGKPVARDAALAGFNCSIFAYGESHGSGGGGGGEGGGARLRARGRWLVQAKRPLARRTPSSGGTTRRSGTRSGSAASAACCRAPWTTC
jgi:hypothetical protein